MQLTITERAQSVIGAHLHDNTVILLSYDDGVGPYSPHGLEALQIAFKLVLIDDSMPKEDYDVSLSSVLGPIYIKGYSQRFLGDHLKIDLNEHYHLLTLRDDGETIEDHLQIEDRQSN